ncbi:Alpha/Beta hydrolase protein [Fomitopsis serialis]|uniref:Alpha/Beta hydrolase protein n=1 Tax=Fomitopsis serialis TaxID=139415 RepID=UPI00200835E5|nr:Alpha/Beta hydrolase protein [Neoantrodia serialis]KAH9937644.1 Alpha/Beta hydrolase protein [Neoantrodia serialis]
MTDTEHPFPVHHSIAALPPDSRIRQIYPEDFFPNGGYVQLPYGRTRYWLLGPEDGVKVVLIHGLSTPGVTWKHFGPYLAERGFRVLVYDLYGKGYSDAPKTAYHANIFWEHAHIAGFSMGGGITAAFAATLPHLVSGKIVLMASAGVHESRLQPLQVSSPIPQYQELIKLQHELLPGYAEGGTLDPLVAYADALEINKRIPHAQLITIEGAGHDFPIHEKYWEVAVKNIAAFLST